MRQTHSHWLIKENSRPGQEEELADQFEFRISKPQVTKMTEKSCLTRMGAN